MKIITGVRIVHHQGFHSRVKTGSVDIYFGKIHAQSLFSSQCEAPPAMAAIASDSNMRTALTCLLGTTSATRGPAAASSRIGSTCSPFRSWWCANRRMVAKVSSRQSRSWAAGSPVVRTKRHHGSGFRARLGRMLRGRHAPRTETGKRDESLQMRLERDFHVLPGEYRPRGDLPSPPEDLLGSRTPLIPVRRRVVEQAEKGRHLSHRASFRSPVG